jgi:hypothetical protein
MTVNSLSPAFVKINYNSAFGAHVMTVPAVPVESGVFAPTGWGFTLRGAALPVPVDDAVTDFVNAIKTLFPSDVTFVDATVYQQPTPSDIPTPVASFALGISGDSGDVGWSKAVQRTITFRADDFTLFKLVALDSDSANVFDKISVVPGGAYGTMVDYITADETWIASRGGGRPNVFLQEASTLNEKLRRSYHMN